MEELELGISDTYERGLTKYVYLRYPLSVFPLFWDDGGTV